MSYFRDPAWATGLTQKFRKRVTVAMFAPNFPAEQPTPPGLPAAARKDTSQLGDAPILCAPQGRSSPNDAAKREPVWSEVWWSAG
jgi:hypothetical protein